MITMSRCVGGPFDPPTQRDKVNPPAITIKVNFLDNIKICGKI